MASNLNPNLPLDPVGVRFVEEICLEKKDATGILFEKIQLFKDDRPGKVVYRRPGQPLESYASALLSLDQMYVG